MTAERDDIVQILAGHPWALCIAVVSERRSWGVIAYVRIPNSNDGQKPPGDAFIRLHDDEYVSLGAKVRWREETL